MQKNAIGFADYAGMTATILCLLHCLAPLLLLSSFPLMSWLPHDDDTHLWLLLLVTLPSLTGLVAGYRRHRKPLAMRLGMAGLGCCGLAVLAIGPHYGHGAEAVLTTLGGVLIFSAHLNNRYCCRGCRPNP